MERAVQLAERQFGRVARRQLLHIGWSPSRIRYWLEQGRLRWLLPGVYALGHASGGDQAHFSAALLYAGAGSALSRRTGLWWLGLLPTRPPRIDIDAPGHRGSLREIAIHHPARIARRDHRGLPTVEPTAAIVGSSLQLSARQLRKVLANAEFRGAVELAELNRTLSRGTAGSRALRSALASHMPQLAHTESELEDDFLFLLERFDLPLPEVNVRIGHFRADALWRERRLIVELDGRDAHTKPAHVAADHARDLKLRSLGYTVVRYTWAQVHFDGEAVAADISRLLAAPARVIPGAGAQLA
ncbi:type IV toxin-antitoxin system AbiEi family antitoxin domain-containing protein [soil metagenome]